MALGDASERSAVVAPLIVGPVTLFPSADLAKNPFGYRSHTNTGVRFRLEVTTPLACLVRVDAGRGRV